MADRQTALIALRAVAALAAKLADDLECNRLWEGDFAATMAEIQKAVRDVPSIR